MKNPLQQANCSAAISLVLFYECVACNQGDRSGGYYTAEVA